VAEVGVGSAVGEEGQGEGMPAVVEVGGGCVVREEGLGESQGEEWGECRE
jgi:hypothetical protein